MTAPISADHPIRELFADLVDRSFAECAGVRDPDLRRYVAELLVDFTHASRIQQIRDATGRPLEEVAEMLAEGDVALNATSFDREREVHKHIGDVTLFWTGVYPEMLRILRAPSRKDHLLDYVQQGRRSYGIAATFEYGRYQTEARTLRRLSEQFERCILGLQGVRRELSVWQGPEVQRLRRFLEA